MKLSFPSGNTILAQKFAAAKFPRYGVDLQNPEIAIRVDPDGTETRGKFDGDGNFVAETKPNT
jgi:hypothetical protein